MQSIDRRREPLTRIGQSHTKNCEIDMFVRRKHRWRSTRIDKDALPVDLDEKGERFAANPIACVHRRSSSSRFAAIEGNAPEYAIVRCRKYAHIPRSDAP